MNIDPSHTHTEAFRWESISMLKCGTLAACATFTTLMQKTASDLL